MAIGIGRQVEARTRSGNSRRAEASAVRGGIDIEHLPGLGSESVAGSRTALHLPQLVGLARGNDDGGNLSLTVTAHHGAGVEYEVIPRDVVTRTYHGQITGT